MPRRSNRLSRTLIVVLLVTLGLGAFAYFHNLSSSRANDQSVAVSSPVEPETHRTPAGPREGVVLTPAAVVAPVRPDVVAPAVVVASNTTGAAEQADAGTDRKATPSTSPSTPAVPDSAPTSSALSAARTQIAAGDLLAARASLNADLSSGQLGASDSAETRKLLSDISQVVYFSPKRFPDDPFGGTYNVAPGDNLAKIGAKFEITPGFLQRLNGITDPKKLRAGQTIKIVKGPFHAVVTKHDFTLDVYMGPPGERGSLFVTQLKVGLGKDDSTPTGVWAVKAGGKLKNPKFWGAGGLKPIDADDPKNPLGEYWIALAGMDGQAVGKDGYGIHGTIDPSSIGTQASLGCIRLKDEDIALVYDLLVDGKSTVTVKP